MRSAGKCARRGSQLAQDESAGQSKVPSGWPDPFDPTLYAAQRNARDFLVSLFVALSFDDAPPAAAAVARLRAFMMQ